MSPNVSVQDPSLSKDKELEILNDHYKDTYIYIREYIKFRDKLFIYILITITAMLYQVFSPLESKDIIGYIITNILKSEKAIDASFIGSVLWFLLLGLVVRYFQTVIYIENQYKYIHQLEDLICPIYDHKAFTREGKSYLKTYRRFSKWIKVLYVTVFPTLLLLVISIKIHDEFISTKSISNLLFFNIIMYIFIMVFTLYYIKIAHQKHL